MALRLLILGILSVLLGCKDLPIEGHAPGECDDRADNDGDGLFDCDDPNCAGAPVCLEPPGDDDDDSALGPSADDDDSAIADDDDSAMADDDDSAGDDDDSAEPLGDDDDSAEPCWSVDFPGQVNASMFIDWDDFQATAAPPVTIEFWVWLLEQPPMTANAMLLQTGASADQWTLEIVGSFLSPCGYCLGCLMLSDSGGVTCTEPLATEVWNHLAITVGGNSAPYEATLFRNGEIIEPQDPADNPSTLNFAPFDDLWLGFEPQNNSLSGSLAQLRISEGLRYTETFSPEAWEPVDAQTLAYWPGDDGTGTVVRDEVSGRDGQLVGATGWVERCLPLGEVPLGDDDDSANCVGDWQQPTELYCDDGCDNDGNGDTDCWDDACVADPFCDAGGDDDDAGPDGPATVSGPGITMPLCCEPNPATGEPTCTSCIEQLGPPPIGCGGDPSGWTPSGNMLDEGMTPCCGTTGPTKALQGLWDLACPECDDGLDNDGDGLIDCDDPDCVDTVHHFQVPGLCGVPP